MPTQEAQNDPALGTTTFGGLIRGLREKAGLSLRQVESVTGVSNAYLSQIELGRVGAPSPKIIERLAVALNSSYLVLLGAAGHLGGIHGPAAPAGLSSSLVDVSDLSDTERTQVIALVQQFRRRHSRARSTPKRRQG